MVQDLKNLWSCFFRAEARFNDVNSFWWNTATLFLFLWRAEKHGKGYPTLVRPLFFDSVGIEYMSFPRLQLFLEGGELHSF
jgi:hypothetical protein